APLKAAGLVHQGIALMSSNQSYASFGRPIAYLSSNDMMSQSVHGIDHQNASSN
ncbi:MAG: hypothetical protein ACI9OD_003934, partial [Limisphaerales bacterium]